MAPNAVSTRTRKVKVSRSRTQTAQVDLYCMRDASGVLLFVGVADEYFAQFYARASRLAWWTKVSSVEVSHHSSIAKAQEAEASIRATETPKYALPEPARTKRSRNRTSTGSTFNETLDRLLVEFHQNTFTLADVMSVSGMTNGSARVAISSALQQGSIVSPAKGFYVRVPMEYRSVGTPPAWSFLAPMMDHLGVDYYVSHLSAADYWGASHQAAQQFQVVVSSKVSDRQVGHLQLRFVEDGNLQRASVVNAGGFSGTVRVASPETTAFDLVERPDVCAGLSNVATVLLELKDLEADELAAQAAHRSVHVVRRLGWLLERIDHPVDTSALLVIAAGKAPITPLVVGVPYVRDDIDRKWRVAVNAEVDPDEL